MKTGGGDFSAESYEQLREAYSKEQQRAVDDEIKGTQVMGMEYGLETLPVDSPWKDKIENWTYPSGKGQYIDEHQSPDDVLKIMREAAQERLDAKKVDEDPEVEEEVEETVDEIPVEEEETEEEVTAEVEEEEEEEEVVAEVAEEEEETEEEEVVAEVEEEEVEEEEEKLDPEELASQIAELRAEIEGLNFVNDQPEVEESVDDESE